jgi:hypothetical protein|tara:strand:+ start:3325 stop:3843 length:519 start_codon:yes stop_codon:yes gene_type:complete
MSIIIVGNGTSILDKPNGNKIDSFDTVLRFNGFKIKGHEEYTGIKTNIWFTVNHAHVNQIDAFDEVVVHSWQWDSEKCKIYQDFISKRNDCKQTDGNFVRTKIKLRSPSTGMIAIHMMLERYDKVTITGFDWWDRSNHHYGDNEPRGTLHNPKEEHRIIQDLVEKNKVKFLD